MNGENLYTYHFIYVWETAVHLAVAGGVFDVVFFVLSFFPLDVLDEVWDLIESVSEGFLTYFYIFSYHIYFVTIYVINFLVCLI